MLPGAVEAIGRSRCARKEAKNDVCNWRDWARTFIFFSFEGPVGYQRFKKMATIADTAEWKALEEHAAEVKKLHLRTLIGDASRTAALQCSDAGGLWVCT